ATMACLQVISQARLLGERFFIEASGGILTFPVCLAHLGQRNPFAGAARSGRTAEVFRQSGVEDHEVLRRAYPALRGVAPVQSADAEFMPSTVAARLSAKRFCHLRAAPRLQ